MLTVISIIHVVAAILLIIVVLIQDSKGGGVAGAFGGGTGNANTVLGATGAASFMVKLTRTIVLIFAITAITLTKMASNDRGSVLDTGKLTPTEIEQAKKASETAPAAPATTSETAAPAATPEKK